jgi:hypothetical protein
MLYLIICILLIVWFLGGGIGHGVGLAFAGGSLIHVLLVIILIVIIIKLAQGNWRL